MLLWALKEPESGVHTNRLNILVRLAHAEAELASLLQADSLEGAIARRGAVRAAAAAGLDALAAKLLDEYLADRPGPTRAAALWGVYWAEIWDRLVRCAPAPPRNWQGLVHPGEPVFEAETIPDPGPLSRQEDRIVRIQLAMNDSIERSPGRLEIALAHVAAAWHEMKRILHDFVIDGRGAITVLPPATRRMKWTG